jgi:hypothetical protein
MTVISVKYLFFMFAVLTELALSLKDVTLKINKSLFLLLPSDNSFLIFLILNVYLSLLHFLIVKLFIN